MKFGIIGFDDYKITCIIGVYEEEKIAPQDIFLDLRIEYDFSIPAKNDAFEETICYVVLSNICKELALTKKYRLLETLAYDIIDILLNQYNVKWAFVKIKKPSAIPDAECAIVELEGGKRS